MLTTHTSLIPAKKRERGWGDRKGGKLSLKARNADCLKVEGRGEGEREKNVKSFLSSVLRIPIGFFHLR